MLTATEFVESLRSTLHDAYPKFQNVFGTHTLALEAGVALCDLLVNRRPRRILEFGAGLSSLLFGTYAVRTGAHFVSVTERGKWHDRLLAILPDYRLASLQFDLVDFDPRVGWYNWPSTSDQLCDKYDLIFVDGPGDVASRQAPAAWETIQKLLASTGALVVDDAGLAKPKGVRLFTAAKATAVACFAEFVCESWTDASNNKRVTKVFIANAEASAVEAVVNPAEVVQVSSSCVGDHDSTDGQSQC